MRSPFLHHSLFLGCCLLLVGCGPDNGGTPDNPLLARVQQKELYLAELEGMFPADADRQDSLLIIQSFVSRWSHEAVMEHEAERNLPADLQIDQLVRDYRASLVSNHYQEVLVGMRLDSNITRQQLEAYYEEHKGQYLLERPIVRCLFIRVPYPIVEEDRLRELWDNGKVRDTSELRGYCERFAEVSLLDPPAWYSLDDIAEQLPPGILTANNVQEKKEFSLQEGSYRYYFRLLEVRPRREVAPLSYVEDQARKVILHNRKLQVLADAREELYQRELRKNNIETFY